MSNDKNNNNDAAKMDRIQVPTVSLSRRLSETLSSPLPEDAVKIDVERKFTVPEGCEEALVALGAKLVREENYREEYFDTKEYLLTRNDYWLRRRSGTFQLTYPQGEKGEEEHLETQDREVMVRGICKLLGNPSAVNSVESFVSSACHQVASIKTSRKRYTLDGGLKVSLDLTDFGFRLGEIQVVVHDRDKLFHAVTKIESLAAAIGCAPGPVASKVEVYLRRFHPDHYKLLLSRGLFKHDPPAVY